MATWIPSNEPRTRDQQRSAQPDSSTPVLSYEQKMSRRFATGPGPWKFGVIIVAVLIGIVAVYVTARRLGAPRVHDASIGQRVEPVSPRLRMGVKSQLVTKPTTRATHEAATPQSVFARYEAKISSLIAPTAVLALKQFNAWSARLTTLLGLQDNTRGDVLNARAPVWAVDSSGYYYCAHGTYFKKLKPGEIMRQGEALQKGFRPRLGTYCQ